MPGQEHGQRPTGDGADEPVGTAPERTEPSTANSRRATPGGGGRWRPGNWRVRTKIAVVMLVPALTALAFGGLRVQSELDRADSFQSIVNQVDVALQITDLVHQLQFERALVVTEVARATPELGSSAAVRDQYARTDNATFVLREALTDLQLADAASRERYDLALNQLKQLVPLRELAQGTIYPDLAVLTNYNTLIDPLVQLAREISAGGDSGPSRVSTAVQTLGQAKERGAQLDALLLIASVRNTFGSGAVQNRGRSVDAGFDSAIADFVAVATADERQTYSDGYSGPEVDRRRAIAQTSLSSLDPTAPLDVDPAMLAETSRAANEKLRGVETNLISRLRAQSSAAAEDALAAAWRDAAIVIAALVVALLLMLTIAWSLLTPLRRLRREALEVARTRLPETVKRILADPNPVEAAKKAVEPVPVFTNEEIGQLARSFDAVHEQAVKMATEQAVLRDNVNNIFVNLSRRSQVLIERQLAELDQLEQNEQDPDQLSRFFVLDHLAARMRRNSENLLILSGSGLAKRMARPVQVGEVIESALSEVEHYTRVRVKSVPDLLIQGRVVKDLVHLIAELLDNAATFSAPDTVVTVTSARVRSGELAIQISDDGMGMSDEELDEANERLANPPDFDVSLSRRMGLYVVARLAQRHAIRVRLHGDIDAGTTAVITLPPDLMAKAAKADNRALSATQPSRIPSSESSLTARVPQVETTSAAQHTATQSIATQSIATQPGREPARRQPPQRDDRQAEPPREPRRAEPQRADAHGSDSTRTDIHPVARRRSPSPAAESPATPADVFTGQLPMQDQDKQAGRWFAGGKHASPAPEEVAPPAENGWDTPADQGWRTVRSRLETEPGNGVAAGGLPKRSPQSRLVPGSAPAAQPRQPRGGGEATGQPNPSGLPQRSPDDVRARLSGFQQGLRRARRPEDENGHQREDRGEL